MQKRVDPGSDGRYFSTAPPDTVRCRPAADAFGAAGFFAFLGVLVGVALPLCARQGPTRETILGCAALALMLWVPAVLFLVWGLRAVVVADAGGMRWRFLAASRRVSWEEVSDYYLIRPPKNRERLAFETAAGTFRISADWKNSDALREIVERNAHRARARRWGLKGARPEDPWPRVFDYRASASTRALLPAITLGLGLPVLMTGGRVPDIAGWFRDLGIGGGIAVSLLVLFTLLSMPLLLAAMTLALWRSARRRRDERVTADPQGIAFEGAAGTIRVGWEEVEDFRIVTERGFPSLYAYAVRTSRGTFGFTHAIAERALLCAIIARYAVRAASREWHPRADADLLQNPDMRAPSGVQVFRYRTRTNRALLWFPLAFAIVPLIGPLASRLLGVDASPPMAEIVSMSGVFSVLTLWGWWRYRAASIEIDEDGIAQNTLFGRRRMLWRNVEDFYATGAE